MDARTARAMTTDDLPTGSGGPDTMVKKQSVVMVSLTRSPKAVHIAQDGELVDHTPSPASVTAKVEAAASPAPPLGSSPGALRRAVTIEEAKQIRELPNLMDRISAMGLTDEYITFRERYLGWRRGEHTGATGEISHHNLARNRGWGFWYPTMQVWQWRRTLSYWIAVTFFEGSLFFTVSSFLWCYPEYLGDLKRTVTLWGYVGGKINFMISCYLMCLETINLSNAEVHQKALGEMGDAEKASGDESTDSDDSVFSVDSSGHEKWRWSPFHVRTALRKLHRLGAGPWPYWASFLYFLGVLTFTVGLVIDFLPEGTLSKHAGELIKNIAFTTGSLNFVFGGFAECIENGVFSGCDIDQGWVGAFLNTSGSVGFLIGSLISFFPGESTEYWSSMAFAIGSALFTIGSAVMIVMWKDEQFGLTFLAVLNRLGGEHGKPIVAHEADGSTKVEEEKTLSLASAIFIMVYCFTGMLSWYDFLICLHGLSHAANTGIILERAFNAFLPFIFAHFMLALTCGVYRTPQVPPFHQLYIGCRIMAICMCINSGARFVQALQAAYCVSQGLCLSEGGLLPASQSIPIGNPLPAMPEG